MSNQPTVEDLRRLRAAAQGNTAADAAYVAAWNRASQAGASHRQPAREAEETSNG